MKITEMTVFTGDLQLGHVYHHSGACIEKYEQVYLKLVSDDGTFGAAEVRGNCAYVTHEEREDVLQALRKQVAPLMADISGIDMEPGLDLIQRHVQSHAARTLVDVCWHDLDSKILGVPLYERLGGRRRDSVKGFCGVPFAGLEESEKKIRTGVQEGRDLFKVRVGLEPMDRDLERLKLLRSLAPEQLIGVDANGCWSANEAVRRIKAMEPFGLAFVEQPVPGPDLQGLGHVRDHVSVPIMADESLVSLAALHQLIENRFVDSVNIKLLKAGGIQSLQRMIQILVQAGMPFQFDSMSSGRLDSAATLHAQCSIGADALYFGGGGFASVLKDPASGLEFERGSLFPSRAAGLGVFLDEACLSRVFSVRLS